MPFCASRCDYCAFATWTDRHHLAEAYVDSCLRDYEAAQRSGVGSVTTIFLGGGTPSQLPNDDLVRLLAAFEHDDGAEVSVEANPEDVTAEWLSACVGAGVNRISLGVQSLDPVVLNGLGRRHDPEAVAQAVANIAAAGIGRYSVDLIYGGFGETDESWLRTLDGVLGLEPSPGHVSAYALTVEAGTPLALDRARHPDDDVQAVRYEQTDAVLSAAGMSWYEISNWSLPGEESRHNLNYWMEGDYLGLGCAAHSHRGGRRWWNVRTPDRYIELVDSGASPESVSETLPLPQRHLEALELFVRTRLGVPVDTLADALATEPALQDLVAVDGRSGRLVLTLAGRLLANEVACRLRPNAPKVVEMAATLGSLSTWPNRSSG
ncbi:MAG: radical SAM family heme chaperone HemW [Acidimicrobiales bacterium]